MDVSSLPFAIVNPFFWLAGLLSLITLTISVWRFWFLIGRRYTISFFEIGKIVWASTFLNTFVPSGVSGDVYRGLRLRDRVPDAELAILIVFDKIVGLYTLILISALIIPWAGIENRSFAFLSWSITIGGLFSFVLAKFFSHFFSHRYPRIARIFLIIYSLRSKALSVLSISLFAHLVGGLSIFCLALSMPEAGNLQLLETYAVTPYALIVSAFPILPGGIGTGHLAFAYVFREVGYLSGADIFTLYLLLQCSIALVGSFFVTEKFKNTARK